MPMAPGRVFLVVLREFKVLIAEFGCENAALPVSFDHRTEPIDVIERLVESSVIEPRLEIPDVEREPILESCIPINVSYPQEFVLEALVDANERFLEQGEVVHPHLERVKRRRIE